MVTIEVPGYKTLNFAHLVLDYNGTLACDGKLLVGVRRCLTDLAQHLSVHVVTADTFGSARNELAGVACDVVLLAPTEDGEVKRSYVERLGAHETVCIGNGRNDCAMLQEAVLSIAILGTEGAASDALKACDVVAPDIVSALELLRHPQRLIATLRA
jgi:soluble P-type ATPase